MKGVIIDIESGGLDPVIHAVTEIGAVCFEQQDNRLVEVSHYHTTVYPGENVCVTEHAARIQGRTIPEIYSYTVDECDAFDGLVAAITNHLGTDESGYDWEGRLWVHNAQFDLPFLAHMGKRIYRPRIFQFRDVGSCTRRLAQNLMGLGRLSGTSVSLSQLAERFGIPVDHEQRHGALYDARLTLEVMCRWRGGCDCSETVPGTFEGGERETRK